MQSLSNFPWHVHRIRTNDPKTYMESHMTRIAKDILRTKNKAGGINFPDFTQHYRATVFQTRGSWHRNRPRRQWKSTETPGTNPYIDNQLIFHHGNKNIWLAKISLVCFCKMLWENMKEDFSKPKGKKTLSSASGVWGTHTDIGESLKLGSMCPQFNKKEQKMFWGLK